VASYLTFISARFVQTGKKVREEGRMPNTYQLEYILKPSKCQECYKILFSVIDGQAWEIPFTAFVDEVHDTARIIWNLPGAEIAHRNFKIR
jgi:hypothetical protein